MRTPCKLCGKPSVARELCNKHYRAFMAYGDPIESKNLRGVPFNRRYTVDPQSGCWVWIGSTNQDGYGLWSAHGEKRAHRASFVLHHGVIPKGMHVLHTCDNPGCVNPDHLRLGTHQDNMADLRKKGRAYGAAGETNKAAKLTERQAIQIMSDSRSCGVIATEYGVSSATIDNIRNGKTWAHIFSESTKNARVASGRNKPVSEATVLSMRESHTQTEIAAHLGISQSRVSTILRAYGASRGKHTSFGKGHGTGGRRRAPPAGLVT